MALEGLDGTAVEIQSPSVGHSITGASTPLIAKKGSTSSEGSSSEAYKQFIAKVRKSDEFLRKATWSDQQAERLMRRLDMIHEYVEHDPQFYDQLKTARAIDIAKMEEAYTERLQALRGQATHVIGVHHQAKVDEVLPKLMEVMKQRGLEITQKPVIVDGEVVSS